MRALLEDHPVRWRTLADLVVAALAARLAPERREKEERTMAQRGRGYTRCSFCGKGQDKVRRLVAGPGVYICDSCIELCHEVLAMDAGKPRPQAPGGPPPTPPTVSGRRRPVWLRRILGGRGNERCVPVQGPAL